MRKRKINNFEKLKLDKESLKNIKGGDDELTDDELLAYLKAKHDAARQAVNNTR